MTAETKHSPEIPDVYYPNSPLLITPDRPSPKHSLYLSNLDDQKFLRFSIKYLYLFEKAVSVETLKASLSRVLSEYYPLAGRLKAASFDADGDNDQKLQVECNDEGAVFAEAFIDLSAQEFLEFSAKPNSSWRKLLYKVDAHSFLDVPPLVVQSLIGEFQVEFTQKSARVKSLDLHPLQPWILVGLYSGNVEVWNYQSKKLEKSFEVSSNVPVRSAKFVARKGWIVTGSDDKFIRVYDYNTEEKVKEFEAHEDYIRCIVVHPTLPHVISASDDKHIKLWDWEKEWICTQTFEGHSHYVMQVAFNPIDHNNFASASLDGSIKIWNLGNSNPVTTIDAHEKGVNCVNYFTNEGKLYLVTGSDDHTTKVWDYKSLSCNKVLEGHTNNVTTILTHPELPNLILTGSEDKNVYVWDAATSKLEMTLDQGLGRVWIIEFEKTTSKFIIGCDEGFLIGKIVGA